MGFCKIVRVRIFVSFIEEVSLLTDTKPNRETGFQVPQCSFGIDRVYLNCHQYLEKLWEVWRTIKRMLDKFQCMDYRFGMTYPSPVTGSQPFAATKPGDPQPGLLPTVMSLKASG
jgi:hypothetical protein